MKELNLMVTEQEDSSSSTYAHYTLYIFYSRQYNSWERISDLLTNLFFYCGLPDFICVACQFNLLCDLWLYKHWIQKINKSIFYIIIVDVIFMRIFITNLKKEIVFTKCKTLFKPHLVHFVFWPICNQRCLAFHVLSMIVTFHVECNKYSIHLL